jgi:hypothetical protein
MMEFTKNNTYCIHIIYKQLVRPVKFKLRFNNVLAFLAFYRFILFFWPQIKEFTRQSTC